MSDAESIALILDVLRANRLHQSTCSQLRAIREERAMGALIEDKPGCDCWLDERPPTERGWWSNRDLTELAGDPADKVRVTEYSNIAAASRRYMWPDGRVRRFDRNRGDLGWTEVADA